MAHISNTAASTKTAFDAAVRDFQDELPDKEEFSFQGIETIDDVYREIERTQEEQGRTRQLRNMKKIAPFLASLEEYSGVLDTLVQAKASVLALIWVSINIEAFHWAFSTEFSQGPIKFLLQVLLLPNGGRQS